MSALEAFVARQTGKTIGLAVHDLESGREILLNPDQDFHPASTFKVHVMLEAFHQAAQGRLSLDDRLPIVNAFTSIADGSPYSLLEQDDSELTLYARLGETETIRELTRLMIVRSSNLATNILIERLGTQNINDFLRELGIDGVTVRRGVEDKVAFRQGLNNRATARGLTQTMGLIAEGQVVSQAACQEMLEILLGQEFNESIPAPLPASVRVAHKTGWTGDVYHDTGLVYSDGRRPYAISILTRGFPEDQPDSAHACLAEVSKLVFESLR